MLHGQWQEDLLPEVAWHARWSERQSGTKPDTAARWLLAARSLAATQDRAVEVASERKTELTAGTFTRQRLQHRCHRRHALPVPEVASVQHERSSADPRCQPQAATPVASLTTVLKRLQLNHFLAVGQPVVRVASPLGDTPSHPGAWERRSMPLSAGGRRSQSVPPRPDVPRAHRARSVCVALSAMTLRQSLVSL